MHMAILITIALNIVTDFFWKCG